MFFRIVEQRLRDREDLIMLREQNKEWMIEAERKLKRIQEKIDREQLKRIADARGGRHVQWVEVRR